MLLIRYQTKVEFFSAVMLTTALVIQASAEPPNSPSKSPVIAKIMTAFDYFFEKQDPLGKII